MGHENIRKKNIYEPVNFGILSKVRKKSGTIKSKILEFCQKSGKIKSKILEFCQKPGKSQEKFHQSDKSA